MTRYHTKVNTCTHLPIVTRIDVFAIKNSTMRPIGRKIQNVNWSTINVIWSCVTFISSKKAVLRSTTNHFLAHKTFIVAVSDPKFIDWKFVKIVYAISLQRKLMIESLLVEVRTMHQKRRANSVIWFYAKEINWMIVVSIVLVSFHQCCFVNKVRYVHGDDNVSWNKPLRVEQFFIWWNEE